MLAPMIKIRVNKAISPLTGGKLAPRPMYMYVTRSDNGEHRAGECSK